MGLANFDDGVRIPQELDGIYSCKPEMGYEPFFVLGKRVSNAHGNVMKQEIYSKPEELFLTPAEVASRYKVTSRTVLNWMERGDLRAIRLGKVIRFRLSDVIKAVEK